MKHAKLQKNKHTKNTKRNMQKYKNTKRNMKNTKKNNIQKIQKEICKKNKNCGIRDDALMTSFHYH